MWSEAGFREVIVLQLKSFANFKKNYKVFIVMLIVEEKAKNDGHVMKEIILETTNENNLQSYSFCKFFHC